MSEFLVSILNGLLWLTSIPSHIPAETWAFLGSSLGVSVIMQGLKHWLDEQVDPRWLITITTLLSGLAACLVFVINGLTQNPMLLGSDTATILGITTLLYRFAVAPAYGFLLDVHEYQTSKKSTLSDAVENEIKTINATSVLPTTTVTASVTNAPAPHALTADEFDG